MKKVPIDKLRLFEETKKLWPNVITYDGMEINKDSISGLQILNVLHQNIKNKFDDLDDWTGLTIWAFHQALWVHSKKELSQMRSKVFTSDVTFEMFEHWMQENLCDDFWEAEREVYNSKRGEKGQKVCRAR